MDSFVLFSFLQGAVAFFAPCAVALLPAYIASFVSRHKEKESSKTYLLKRGVLLASMSILAILIVYSIAGVFIVLASQLIKEYMKWVAMTMGGVVIILGVLMLFGKDVSINLHVHRKQTDNEKTEAFLFGGAYAIGALGCLFPLFLVVATQAIAAPTITVGASYILAYFAGISSLMMITIVGSIFAKDWIQKHLHKVLAKMNYISGVLLILAGIYIIRYQLVLV